MTTQLLNSAKNIDRVRTTSILSAVVIHQEKTTISSMVYFEVFPSFDASFGKGIVINEVSTVKQVIDEGEH